MRRRHPDTVRRWVAPRPPRLAILVGDFILEGDFLRLGEEEPDLLPVTAAAPAAFPVRHLAALAPPEGDPLDRSRVEDSVRGPQLLLRFARDDRGFFFSFSGSALRTSSSVDGCPSPCPPPSSLALAASSWPAGFPASLGVGLASADAGSSAATTVGAVAAERWDSLECIVSERWRPPPPPMRSLARGPLPPPPLRSPRTDLVVLMTRLVRA